MVNRFSAPFAHYRLLMYIALMKHHSKSGRIVVDVDPKLKRKLYAALALSGDTLKEWFVKEAAGYSQNFNSHSQTIVEESPADYSVADNSINRKGRSRIEQEAYSVVSMFTGCGGLDLGFLGDFEIFGTKYEKRRFEIVWANDLNKAACNTYLKNFRKEIKHGDVWNLLGTLPKQVDVVIGGFPCQDISVNGKRAGANGTKSGLYKAMVSAVQKLQPKVFVAENVKGLLMKYNSDSLEQVLRDFRSLGYQVHYQLYSAADYGVPQTRDRVFFVGTRKDIKPFAPPAPVRMAHNWMTAKEAIGDLENESKNYETNHIWSKANPSSEQGNRKLKANRPGYTIRAECHGNIQFHYSKPRRISMREAARFQTFPDRFIFDGGLRETERQIGNAVPPVLAWHISGAILECLES